MEEELCPASEQNTHAWRRMFLLRVLEEQLCTQSSAEQNRASSSSEYRAPPPPELCSALQSSEAALLSRYCIKRMHAHVR
jgi:hypothetical protein